MTPPTEGSPRHVHAGGGPGRGELRRRITPHRHPNACEVELRPAPRLPPDQRRRAANPMATQHESARTRTASARRQRDSAPRRHRVVPRDRETLCSGDPAARAGGAPPPWRADLDVGAECGSSSGGEYGGTWRVRRLGSGLRAPRGQAVSTPEGRMVRSQETANGLPESFRRAQGQRNDVSPVKFKSLSSVPCSARRNAGAAAAWTGRRSCNPHAMQARSPRRGPIKSRGGRIRIRGGSTGQPRCPRAADAGVGSPQAGLASTSVPRPHV